MSTNMDKAASSLGDEDRVAISLVYKRFYDKIFGFCYKLVQHDKDAEDLTAEVFVRLLDHWALVKERENIGPWLYVVARNLCMDYFKRRKLAAKSKESADLRIPDPYAYIEAYLVQEIPLDLEAEPAFGQLSPEDQRLLRLYLNGKSAAEISAELEIEIQQLYARKRTALARLRILLLKGGIMGLILLIMELVRIFKK